MSKKIITKVEKTFVSSKNIIIGIVINVTVIALTVGSIMHLMEGKAILPSVSIVTIIYLISTFYNSKYIVKNGHLIIVSGFFKSKDYSISEFRRLRKSRTLLASPASGMRRIEIDTEEGQTLIISPKRQKEFIELITKINPKIEKS